MAIIEGVVVGADTGFYTTEIEQSLRFDSASSSYLSWTPASAGNRKTWTFSTWVKRGNLGATQVMFGSQTNALNTMGFLFLGSDKLHADSYVGGSLVFELQTNAVFRDVGAWYHVTLVVDTTQATASDRIKMYVNGVQETSFASATYPAQNTDLFINQTNAHGIGCSIAVQTEFLDGYLAETHFIDGTAYDATAFGEFKNGVWIPKTPSVTYGTNGFYLDYSNGASIGADSSGNSNNWTPTNLASTDVMLDSPTNSFATLNPLDSLNGTTYWVLSEGNLRRTYSPAGSDVPTWSNFAVSSGKWYVEGTYTSAGYLGDTRARFGVSNGVTFDAIGNNVNSYGYKNDGQKSNNSSSSAYGSSYAVGDIIGIALDLDAGNLTFYKNGVSQGVAYSGLSGSFVFGLGEFQGSVMFMNFGQDSSFAGNKTPQGYTDANGIGDFYYAPPAGYLALCTANLPEPAIGPNSATTADENFNTVIWSAESPYSDISITGVGFQPDMVWTKNRSQAYVHQLYDAVRGAGVGKDLTPNEATAENKENGVGGYISSFDSDGFTGTEGSVDNSYFNYNSSSAYVAWNWKADNTSGSTNTDGTITSTVAANVDAGFSIVSYTGTGANSTVGHGLSSAPEMVIVKSRAASRNWLVGHDDIAWTKYLWLDSTNAAASASSAWQNTAPSSSVFSLGTSALCNTTENYIAYCFHSVEGYSKFGSYTGNGSSDGPFVYCGFRPAFVMVKNATTSGTYWHIVDAARETYNVTDSLLFPNDSLAETTNSAYNTDLTSNGFKIRNTNNTHNTSGNTYIYMAFAENPFKYSNAR